MSAPPEGERGGGRTQRFRTVVAALVIGVIVGTLALLYVLALPGAAGAIGGICTIAFLAVAFVAWEYLMKPGYGFLHRERSQEPDESPPEKPLTARKVPRSPRSP